MLVIQRLIRCNTFQSPNLSGIKVNRRWISQTKALLNQDESQGPKTINDTTTIKSKKNRINKLSDLVQIKADGPPISDPNQRLSPISFINQGKYKIPKDWRKDKEMPEWKRQKFALNEKFEGKTWNPAKRLSREEMNGVRMLKQELPDMTTTDIAQTFKVSPEAIRRILKSKWTPTLKEEENMFDRWRKRGEKVKVIMSKKEGSSSKKISISEKDGYQVISNTKSKRREIDPTTGDSKTMRFKHKKPFKNASKPVKRLQDIMF
ncbi:hypothetical protein BN7_1377 [Wickerhamomyces ciferrii]|uniref:Required for respiratory growth protein 9, mitochondrial n=1 Tax=Wickerhamomyces ciferrii (strain ATCC 14091 / BCRC 22168 / CBS 111 / JCM 3599 / NBRC 0793 / NRRL Y-1031 F-60-10) TaxID=1206466 RepID=K0KL66_WICCF|nr:uncharacterized protein BN7_1377 [Wickerhamomyces ciferrii]CCH41838.1 hypothetical protein BN7_1377 [Wickerhamomyces ciferrii]